LCEETHYNDWEDNPREGQDWWEDFERRTVLFNGEDVSSGQGFFIGKCGILSLCSKRMQSSQLFVNGRYEQSWTY
jgi:hypothetical protein